MSIGKRIKIVLLLGAGGIATALTLFRVAKAVDFLNSDDITVDYTPISILTLRLRLSSISEPPDRASYP
uniref:Uncharacterized protein n=1 Tax=Fusarium oxysporum (strain Fo5176) TaxID=660025 RepID=A0A0D2XYG7_FUSOF